MVTGETVKVCPNCLPILVECNSRALEEMKKKPIYSLTTDEKKEDLENMSDPVRNIDLYLAMKRSAKNG